MFLPLRLLALELKRSSCWKEYLHYQKFINKVESNSLRIKFLENCKRADVIPRFLKFRIPNNGCFDEKSVHEFQRQLLRKELYKAKTDLETLNISLNEKREKLKLKAPRKCLPSIILYTRYARLNTRKEQKETHTRKLANLSEEQERPLFSVQNTVVTSGLDLQPPAYVLETLSLGPKSAVLDRFDPKDVLAEIDRLLHHCKKENIPDETITDINVKTLNYVKKCKKLKSSKNIQRTKKYLKDHDLLAIPFDKGVGICIMKKETYHERMDDIIKLPQFEKVVKKRKNEKHPIFKEEERIINTLKSLKEQEKIDEELYAALCPRGSQPARLYGLAKVHKSKEKPPMRPVLSMPGSAYHKVAVKVAEWLSVVPECRINASTKSISDSLKEIVLEEDEEVISFDVKSLYTNVPVKEAIQVCTELLYNMPEEKRPPVDRETFATLTEIASCNVIMLTHDGYYKQKDGLAMGSPPAPHLANGWLSDKDGTIRGNAKLFARYMDDIIREIKRAKIDKKLEEINSLHENLKFTIEREEKGTLPFLDMLIIHDKNRLSSTWYNKPTDTGLIMNFHALAPKRYKRSVVSGFVYRIHRACSSWRYFHESLEKAKRVLEHNQYPPNFYEPIIKETLESIIRKEYDTEEKLHHSKESEGRSAKVPIIIQYRGKCTEDYARALHKCKAPCTIVMTLRKLKTVLPSLKPSVDKMFKSGVVYKIMCSRCKACYVHAV